MLGKYADQFFASMARERVLTISPNGLAGECAFPDRGEQGTGAKSRFRCNGNLDMPGPQNSFSANRMMPGMGQMLPGMGQMLPGMGMFKPSTTPLLIAAAAIAGAFLLAKNKKARRA